MSSPIIAIVGRANVGKSTIFNKLTHSRSAIVNDTPGVTRDRIYGSADFGNRSAIIVDTGAVSYTHLTLPTILLGSPVTEFTVQPILETDLQLS